MSDVLTDAPCVLIVESEDGLRELWSRHIARTGAEVFTAASQSEAARLLQTHSFDAMILDLVLETGSAMAIADLASYRQPDCKVIFVTNTSFFSDGTIFKYFSNACAYLPSGTPAEDLTAMVEHYAGIRRP